MKQATFTILLAVACFALAVECGPDPQRQKIALATFHLTDEIDKLTRKFEIAASSGNKVALQEVLTESKKLPTNISTLQYDIKELIAKVDNFEEHAFRERMQAEFELVAVNAKARQLKAVQLEILGINSGVSQPPHYQFSDSLTLTLNYIAENFITSFIKLAEVDELLEASRLKHKNDTIHVGGTVIDSATKTKVLKMLKDFGSSMTAVKAEIELKYSSVMEGLRLRGEELSLRPRFEIESGIDSINFAMHYAVEISAMIEKYSTVNHKLANFLPKF